MNTQKTTTVSILKVVDSICDAVKKSVGLIGGISSFIKKATSS